jgi:hypothetical protein
MLDISKIKAITSSKSGSRRWDVFYETNGFKILSYQVQQKKKIVVPQALRRFNQLDLIKKALLTLGQR